jgi:hypothetical protein
MHSGVTIPKLERSQWYDFARNMNWSFNYLTVSRLMPAYDKARVKIAACGVGALSLLLLCPSALALDPSLDVS